MKSIVLVAVFFAAIASPCLNAQAAGDLVAKIPFDFRVGPSAMPAGTYVIHGSSGVLSIRGGGRGIFQMGTPMSNRTDPNTEGIVIFHRYGDTYFLASAWNGRSQYGIALKPGTHEKELARQSPETRTVALSIK
jgi:hypothetical protein